MICDDPTERKFRNRVEELRNEHLDARMALERIDARLQEAVLARDTYIDYKRATEEAAKKSCPAK